MKSITFTATKKGKFIQNQNTYIIICNQNWKTTKHNKHSTQDDINVHVC